MKLQDGSKIDLWGWKKPSSWKIVKLPDAEPRKGILNYRAIALTSVMSKWYATCTILQLEREKEPEDWKQLHMGA